MTKRLTKRLSASQERAIEALLVGASDQQAAEAAGVARTTVTAWRNGSKQFKDALITARRDLLRRTSSRLHAATTVAVRALEDVAKDTANPSARVNAARSILEFSYRSRELEDLEERIGQLEADASASDAGSVRILRRRPDGSAFEFDAAAPASAQRGKS